MKRSRQLRPWRPQRGNRKAAVGLHQGQAHRAGRD